MDLQPVSINSTLISTALKRREPEPKPEPEPEPEPESQYEEDSSPIYHEPHYMSVPMPMQTRGLFEDDKIVYIGLFVCFVFGFFMGKSLQPIIVRPN